MMDEQTAHDLIEKAAAPYLAVGFQPADSEPGEWLTLEHPDGSTVDIDIDCNDDVTVYKFPA